MNCYEIFISPVVTIIGFVVSYFLLVKQINANRYEQVTAQRRPLYNTLNLIIDEILRTPDLVFQESYYNSVASFKGQMKLVASKNVLEKYEEYLMVLSCMLTNYIKFKNVCDPRGKDSNIEFVVDYETGMEEEWNHTTEQDVQVYHHREAEYRKTNLRQFYRIEKCIDGLLNAMRADLNLDEQN